MKVDMKIVPIEDKRRLVQKKDRCTGYNSSSLTDVEKAIINKAGLRDFIISNSSDTPDVLF